MREPSLSRSHQQISHAFENASNGTLSGPDELIQAFYPELKRLAAARMRRESVEHSWQPTVLINELYLELLKVKGLRPVQPQDQGQKSAFFALAGQVMKWLLIRHSRPLAWKAEKTEISLLLPEASPGVGAAAQLDNLLDKLAAIDPQLRMVVELRVFEGLSIEESAARLGCSPRTVTRNWRFAKVWLQGNLYPGRTVSCSEE